MLCVVFDVQGIRVDIGYGDTMGHVWCLMYRALG